MWYRALSCAVLGLAVVVLNSPAGGAKKDKKVEVKVEDGVEVKVKDKVDVKVKDGVEVKVERKNPAEDPRAVVGAIAKVNAKAGTFSLKVSHEKGKDLEKWPERTFKVSDKTEFHGPLGGKAKGLADDRMSVGSRVVVIPSAGDATVAEEIHLSVRKKLKKGD